MARKSRKAEQLKQEIISSVPVEQRKLITQPITFTYLNGEMSMTQTRIQTMIMEKLQERIGKALKKKAESGYDGDLFTDADFAPLPGGQTMFLTFDVKYAELGVIPANYKDVDEAAKAMQSIVYEKEITDEQGRKATEYTVVFDKVSIPKDDKSGDAVRRDSIKLRMLPETAHDLFRITPYHRYLKDAIFLFSSSYTGRIYLLINANKQLGTWPIEYEKLRKILLTTYNKETKKATVDKYRDINDFKKRVLEPARREIAEASDRVDCTFDYEFQYPAGKKRGTPEYIIFHIQLTDLGRDMKKAMLESQESVELRNRLCSLGFSVIEANRLMKDCPVNLHQQLSAKAQELKRHLAEAKSSADPNKKIDNPRNYARASLRNFIIEHTAVEAEEVSSNDNVKISARPEGTLPSERIVNSQLSIVNSSTSPQGGAGATHDGNGYRVKDGITQDEQAAFQSLKHDLYVAWSQHRDAKNEITLRRLLDTLQLYGINDTSHTVKLCNDSETFSADIIVPWYWNPADFSRLVAQHFPGCSWSVY